jgi:hypothetical protein
LFQPAAFGAGVCVAAVTGAIESSDVVSVTVWVLRLPAASSA